MPKPPSMASDAEVNEFLKGGATAGPTPSTIPPGGASAAPTGPSGAPKSEYKGILGGGPSNLIQSGIAKGAAEAGVGTARLVGRGIGLFSPSRRTQLGQLAEQEPGVKQLEAFADRPYASNWERAGSVGLGLMGGTAAERGIASGVAGLADRLTPLAQTARTRGLGPFAATKPRIVPTTAGKVTKYVAPVTGAVGAGALGGVAADPQDPVRGAEVGAATAGILPGIGTFMRSSAGQRLSHEIGRHAPAEVLGTVAHMYGVPWHLLWGLGMIPALRHSRVGSSAAKYVFDKAGRIIDNPLASGFVGGSVARAGHTGLPYPGSRAEPASDLNPYTEEDYAQGRPATPSQ